LADLFDFAAMPPFERFGLPSGEREWDRIYMIHMIHRKVFSESCSSCKSCLRLSSFVGSCLPVSCQVTGGGGKAAPAILPKFWSAAA
jgi:hypothetical protein